jgi:hypothetical protein
MSDSDELVRLYGPWLAHTPIDAADLMDSFPARWWIAGGWAIEVFSGVSREHTDLDISVLRDDLGYFCEHIGKRLDVWAADGGSLTPLSQHPNAAASSTCSNLWLRESGTSPWEYDVILMDGDADTWRYKRDRRVSLPLDDLICTAAGIDYLRPVVQLRHKAPGLRRKDQQDFDGRCPRHTGDILGSPALECRAPKCLCERGLPFLPTVTSSF